MKKLLTLLLILTSFGAMAQVPSGEDTTRSSTTLLPSPQWYYKTTQYGRQYYLSNSALAKNDFMINGKYLRAYYPALGANNTFTGASSYSGQQSFNGIAEFNTRAIFRGLTEFVGTNPSTTTIKFSDGITTPKWYQYYDGTDLTFEKSGFGSGNGKVILTDDGNIKDQNGVFFAKDVSGGYAPTTRTISTGYGLTGGGDLSTNRTLVADTAALVSKPNLASQMALKIPKTDKAVPGETTNQIYAVGHSFLATQNSTDEFLYIANRGTYNTAVSGNKITPILNRFIADTAHYKYPIVFWDGYNSKANPDSVFDANDQMIALNGSSRYLVISDFTAFADSVGTTTYNQVMALNAGYASRYGSHYVPLYTYLLSIYNPADPTELAMHNRGLLVTRLTYDGFHINDFGYRLGYAWMQAQGYFDYLFPPYSSKVLTVADISAMNSSPTFVNTLATGKARANSFIAGAITSQTVKVSEYAGESYYPYPLPVTGLVIRADSLSRKVSIGGSPTNLSPRNIEMYVTTGNTPGPGSLGFVLDSLRALTLPALGNGLIKSVSGKLTVATAPADYPSVSGTTGFVPVYTGTSTLANSNIFSSGANLTANYGTQIKLGADNNANTVTTATQKNVRISIVPYTNGGASTSIVNASTTSTTSTVNIGFNTSLENAATNVNIGAASNNTTTTGTQVVGITTGGVSVLKIQAGATTDSAVVHTSGGLLKVVKQQVFLSNTATLDFTSTAAQSSSELTITVTGAADGDVVSLGVPNASSDANSCYTARVSATNTVTVKFNNYSSGAIDPVSGTFKVTVIK